MLKQILKFIVGTPHYNPPQIQDEIPPVKEKPKQPTEAEIRAEEIGNKILAFLDKYPSFEWQEGEEIQDGYFGKLWPLSHKETPIRLMAKKSLSYGSVYTYISEVWPEGVTKESHSKAPEKIIQKWYEQIREKKRKDEQLAAQKFLDLEL